MPAAPQLGDDVPMRSVSLPRMNPMPVNRLGPSAKAATTARVWAMSESCDEVGLDAVRARPVPVTVGAVAPRARRVAPIAGEHVDEGEVALQRAGAEALDA